MLGLRVHGGSSLSGHPGCRPLPGLALSGKGPKLELERVKPGTSLQASGRQSAKRSVPCKALRASQRLHLAGHSALCLLHLPQVETVGCLAPALL